MLYCCCITCCTAVVLHVVLLLYYTFPRTCIISMYMYTVHTDHLTQHTHTLTHSLTHSQPSLDQFISMNRDIDNGKELPREMLTVRQDP